MSVPVRGEVEFILWKTNHFYLVFFFLELLSQQRWYHSCVWLWRKVFTGSLVRRSTPWTGLNGGTPPECIWKVGNSRDEVYQRVRKSIIYLEEPLLKCLKKTRIMAISLKFINITLHENDKHTTCFSDLFFFDRLVNVVSFYSGRNTKGARGRISGRSLPTRFTELCVCLWFRFLVSCFTVCGSKHEEKRHW